MREPKVMITLTPFVISDDLRKHEAERAERNHRLWKSCAVPIGPESVNVGDLVVPREEQWQRGVWGSVDGWTWLHMLGDTATGDTPDPSEVARSI